MGNIVLQGATSGSTTLTPTDATTQTLTLPSGTGTLALTSQLGVLSQVFTSSGTFTIPAGISAVKVTVVGGGGAGACQTMTNYPGGSVGGTSSFGSYVTCTGGHTGQQQNTGGTAGYGGTASTSGTAYAITATGFYGGAGGGTGILSGYQTQGVGGSTGFGIGTGSFIPATSVAANGLGYGCGGSGNDGGAGGGGAGAAIAWITGLTPGNTITVTVGSGVTGNNYSSGYGAAGNNGIVIVEW
jgi:hypothetical protein